jgi:hypothetical protein
MLELNVAALLGHLDPSISLKNRDYFPAIHSVYLYTSATIVNMKSQFQQISNRHYEEGCETLSAVIPGRQ